MLKPYPNSVQMNDGMLRLRRKIKKQKRAARNTAVSRQTSTGMDDYSMGRKSPPSASLPIGLRAVQRAVAAGTPFFGADADKTMMDDRFALAREALSLPRPFFLVDFVFTFVQDTPRLREEREKYQGTLKSPSMDNDVNRYTSHNELQYAIRAVFMFVPWISNIFIVVGDHPDQFPSFLDRAQGRAENGCVRFRLGDLHSVIVVPHRVLYGKEFASHLPTYNSHSIESHLHRIPGLTEAFIYSNDDFWVHRPLPYTAFFDETGTIAMNNFTRGFVPTAPKTPTMTKHAMAWVNNGRLLDVMFPATKREGRRFQAHAPVPMFKSSYTRLWGNKVMRKALLRTSASKLRAGLDVYCIGLLMYYNKYTAVAAAGRERVMYLQLRAGMSFKAAVTQIVKNNPAVFCLNDSFSSKGSKEALKLSSQMNLFLRVYFPLRLPFEKTHDP